MKKLAASTELFKIYNNVFVLTAKINQYAELTKLTPKIKEY